MQPRHRVSRAAIELIKRFEGYRRKAAQLPDGRWTIGHGHTLTARHGAEVSPDDAEALLLYDLIAVAHALNEQVFAPLTQNQFDALASFAFNIGLDNFRQSGVLRRLNEGALIQAACAMELWRKAEFGGEPIVVDALVRRRSVEKTLFLTPPGEAWVPAPSSILQPLLDTDAGDLVPREPPAAVTAPMNGEMVVVLRDGEPATAPRLADDHEEMGPAKAAAEAVSARLRSIFLDVGEEPAIETSTALVLAEPEEEPFTLRAPDEDEGPEPEVEDEPTGDDNAVASADLFDEPVAADEAQEEAFVDLEAELGEPETDEEISNLRFVTPAVQPLPERPKDGLLTLAALAILGLAFFAGGVFWATNARPLPGAMWLEPRVVGWLAGTAGVGFFGVAVFLLLERLGRASERSARHRAR